MYNLLKKPQNQARAKAIQRQGDKEGRERITRQKTAVPSLADPQTGLYPDFRISFDGQADTPPLLPPFPHGPVQRSAVVGALPNQNGFQRYGVDRTGLPNHLKSSIERLGGYSMDDVRVHYNSAKPARLHAHAYTQGSEIHVAPRQEGHLPHEAWHVVQQKQGRVGVTARMRGVGLNEDPMLEREADVMGAKATQIKPGGTALTATKNPANRFMASNEGVQLKSCHNPSRVVQRTPYSAFKLANIIYKENIDEKEDLFKSIEEFNAAASNKLETKKYKFPKKDKKRISREYFNENPEKHLQRKIVHPSLEEKKPFFDEKTDWKSVKVNRIVFRSEDRAPTTIFKDGFKHRDNLQDVVYRKFNRKTGDIDTSKGARCVTTDFNIAPIFPFDKQPTHCENDIFFSYVWVYVIYVNSLWETRKRQWQEAMDIMSQVKNQGKKLSKSDANARLATLPGSEYAVEQIPADKVIAAIKVKRYHDGEAKDIYLKNKSMEFETLGSVEVNEKTAVPDNIKKMAVNFLNHQASIKGPQKTTTIQGGLVKNDPKSLSEVKNKTSKFNKKLHKK